MNIVCLFIVRHYEPNTPELLVAWDEYTIDGNPEGWAEECKKQLNEVGDDEILTKSYITLSIREEELIELMIPKRGLRAEIIASEEA